MSRSLIVLLIVLVVLIGGLFFLSGRAHVRPTTSVETVVPLGNLAN